MYFRDESAHTTVCADTLRQKLQIKLHVSPVTADTGLTSPSADHILPGAWQGSHWSGNLTGPGKIPTGKAGIEPRSATLEADALTTILTRRAEE